MRRASLSWGSRVALGVAERVHVAAHGIFLKTRAPAAASVLP